MTRLSRHVAIAAAGQALGLYMNGMETFRLNPELNELTFEANRCSMVLGPHGANVVSGKDGYSVAVAHLCAAEALRFTFVDSLEESLYDAELAFARRLLRAILSPVLSDERFSAILEELRKTAYALVSACPQALTVLARKADEHGVIEGADVEAILTILGDTSSSPDTSTR